MATVPATIAGFFMKTLPVRTVEKDTFEFDPESGLIKIGGDRKPYSLVVDGLIREPRSFSYDAIKSFPQVEQVSDFHCVEGWSVQEIRWGGFRFKEILKGIELKPEADYVLFHSFGTTEHKPEGQSHYIESLPLKELLDPNKEILLALTMDGRPLPEDHGAPLRLISPYDLGYKSIKFITRIEFVKKERPGWWTLANPAYPVVARVPERRLRRR